MRPTTNKQTYYHRIASVLIPLAIVGSILIAVRLGDMRVAAKRHILFSSVEKKWRAGDFVSIAEEQQIRQTLERQVDEQFNRAERWQTETARQALIAKSIEALQAYHIGGFSHYAKFRYPRAIRNNGGMNSNFQRDMPVYIAEFKNYESTRVLLEQPSSLESPSGFERFLETDYLSYIALGEGDQKTRYCTNCWDQVDLNSIRIELHFFDKVVPSIHSVIGDDNSLGAVGHPVNPYISPSPKELMSQQGGVRSAFLQWTVKTRQPEEVFPVFIHMYWVPEYREWIPYEFFIASEKGTRFYFHF